MDTTTTRLSLLDGRSVPTAELQAFIEQTLAKADVAGLSCAIINDGRVVYRKAFGERDKRTGARNDEETVFAAASLGKAVFAYLVMLLAEEGVIDLDTPLYEYLARPLCEYPTYADLKSDERSPDPHPLQEHVRAWGLARDGSIPGHLSRLGPGLGSL